MTTTITPDGLPELRATPANLERIAQAIKTGVVEDQKAYHGVNHRRLDQIHNHLEGWSRLFLTLAMGCGAVLLVLAWIKDPIKNNQTVPMSWLTALELTTGLLTIACAALPAMGAAAMGVRYHGDFQRFSQRSEQTSVALDRVVLGLTAFIEQCRGAAGSGAPYPLFETLQAIVMDLEQVLLSDLSDWRFVYRARPGPEPG